MVIEIKTSSNNAEQVKAIIRNVLAQYNVGVRRIVVTKEVDSDVSRIGQYQGFSR